MALDGIATSALACTATSLLCLWNCLRNALEVSIKQNKDDFSIYRSSSCQNVVSECRGIRNLRVGSLSRHQNAISLPPFHGHYIICSQYSIKLSLFNYSMNQYRELGKTIWCTAVIISEVLISFETPFQVQRKIW